MRESAYTKVLRSKASTNMSPFKFMECQGYDNTTDQIARIKESFRKDLQDLHLIDLQTQEEERL
ncbi:MULTISPECIES: hypothetical protein [Acidithrix]|uniref:hypothetical protein n=1 Tax=Acidithrix TaxID=1609233 RepID=UPI0006984AF3|nr:MULTISPECIES: hypothetical protein [Acidithrix]